MRKGFTLVEMMFAVTIFLLVTASLGAASIGIQRLVRRAYAEAELSVRMRLMREKILFHPDRIVLADGVIDNRLLSHNLYFVNLSETLSGFTRAERIVVPVFGTEQEKNANSVFHDDLLP